MRLADYGTVLNSMARPCWHKVRHKSPGAAEAHLRSAHRKPDTLDRPERLEVYGCRHCGGFHVGHHRRALP